MASILPPSPQGVPPGHAFWNVWYEQLRVIINSIASSLVLWTNINFTGSKIQDIVTRDHNLLQAFQGGAAGEYYHLTAAEHATLTTTGILTLYSKAGDPTTADVTASTAKLYKNTSSGAVKLWVNDAGTMKSVALT
jgi:hypothetical protein